MSRLSPDEVILGLLAQHTSHGYQLLEHFRAGMPLGDIWSLGTSQLYTILKRLEHSEDIDGCEFFPADAPPRTEYWLTTAGRQRFEAWLNHPQPSASTRRIRTEFLSRLYLARLLNLPTEPIITAQRQSCQAQLMLLQHRRASMPHDVNYLAVDLLVAEMGVILDWLDRCKENVSNHRGTEDVFSNG